MRPAKRLKEFFDQRTELTAKTRLEEVPHDDFTAFEQKLDKLEKRLSLDSRCILNFTGGNKLMATAAFLWAAKHDIKSFYLERGNRLIWFEPSDDNFTTRSETLDGHITNSLDPVALLRCQLFTSEVEREGEKLTLSKRGQELSEDEFRKRIESKRGQELSKDEFRKRIKNGANKDLMEKTGEGDQKSKAGDALELDAAALLLKLGIKEVRRSLRLKVNTQDGALNRRPHAEIDLLFNWNGKLWLVDCKDRISEDDLMSGLRKELSPRLSKKAKSLLERVGSELKISPTKVLKEDLVAINDIGGLLGQVVCVRKHPLSDEASAYANRNRIEVILKDEMFKGFRRLLYPERKVSPGQLAELERRYSR